MTALQDPNVQVRQAAADFIGLIGPKVALAERQELTAALGKTLSDEDSDVRRAVSGALLRLMPLKPK